MWFAAWSRGGDRTPFSVKTSGTFFVPAQPNSFFRYRHKSVTDEFCEAYLTGRTRCPDEPFVYCGRNLGGARLMVPTNQLLVGPFIAGDFAKERTFHR